MRKHYMTTDIQLLAMDGEALIQKLAGPRWGELLIRLYTQLRGPINEASL